MSRIRCNNEVPARRRRRISGAGENRESPCLWANIYSISIRRYELRGPYIDSPIIDWRWFSVCAFIYICRFNPAMLNRGVCIEVNTFVPQTVRGAQSQLTPVNHPARSTLPQPTFSSLYIHFFLLSRVRDTNRSRQPNSTLPLLPIVYMCLYLYLYVCFMDI